jgi:hypothetical protein
MARANDSLILRGVQGQIGKEIVVKKYGNKTVLSKYPDMTNIKPTKLQKKQRNNFADAVAYAQSINNDPVKKAEYKSKAKRGQSVYQYALKEYLKKK